MTSYTDDSYTDTFDFDEGDDWEVDGDLMGDED